MNESAYYLQGHAGSIYVHSHRAASPNGQAFLFLNPLLDEKNRSQAFQAQTARMLCGLGYDVVRFDYSCTGDSGGTIYELSHATLQSDLKDMADHIRTQFGSPLINLLGVRFGADMAMSLGSNMANVESLHLVEPLFSGSKYILEQRMRRKMFHKLNNMDAEKNMLTVNGKACEDFQGYLLDTEFVSYLEGIDTLNSAAAGKTIYLYKANYLFSKKSFGSFTAKISAANKVTTFETNAESFWEKLETPNTLELSNTILNNLKTTTPC